MNQELSRPSSERGVSVPPSPLAERARRLLSEPGVEGVRRFLEADDARVLAEQRALSEVPAPPFAEAERARAMAQLMAEAGLAGIETDPEGNVVAHLPGSVAQAGRGGDERAGGGDERVGAGGERAGGGGERAGGGDRRVVAGALVGAGALVVSAHLDTVFPAGTDVRVREDGDRLVGPGISDDGRGLAALLGLARALVHMRRPLRRPLLLVATVGEEGAGNLRGVRHLFGAEGRAREARGFISLDGAGMGRIVTAGLGSRRFRVELRGPGGHSWVDWGRANPIHALADAVARWAALPLPTDPMASFTVARWGGGTSVNAIPQTAWVEFDLRCPSESMLDRLEREMWRSLADAVGEAGRGRAGTLDPHIESIGRRPAGETPTDEPLVQAARAATRALGVDPELALSSTDANVPMALGIPALTMGAGGEAGQAHTPEEWYRNVDGPLGIFRALLTVLLADEQG